MAPVAGGARRPLPGAFYDLRTRRDEAVHAVPRKPRKLPVALSIEEICDMLATVPGPGLKFCAALGISYGVGLRASEVCNLKVTDIDIDRILTHVDDDKNGNASSVPGIMSVRTSWLVNCSMPKRIDTPAGTVAVQVPKTADHQDAVLFLQSLERGRWSAQVVMPAISSHECLLFQWKYSLTFGFWKHKTNQRKLVRLWPPYPN